MVLEWFDYDLVIKCQKCHELVATTSWTLWYVSVGSMAHSNMWCHKCNHVWFNREWNEDNLRSLESYLYCHYLSGHFHNMYIPILDMFQHMLTRSHISLNMIMDFQYRVTEGFTPASKAIFRATTYSHTLFSPCWWFLMNETRSKPTTRTGCPTLFDTWHGIFDIVYTILFILCMYIVVLYA